MKKIHLILLAAWIAIALGACGAPAVATTPTMEAIPAPAAVMFTDPALEAMVRGAMGKPEGDITVAEAEAVTRLSLSNKWQQYISDGKTIKDIGGLESFTNLETLDLSYHAISDITPLEGLQKLTWLSLDGNPITDISTLVRLTNLKVLVLSNSAAQDYSPLAKLVHLELLMLDHSTITDLSPLGSLTSLKYLTLAKSPIGDYSPLAEIYPNLEQKDFTIPSTLEELGFAMDENSRQARYDIDNASFRINHSEWGPPPSDGDVNCVWVTLYLRDNRKLALGFYPVLDAYVFQMVKDGEFIMNYIYNPAQGGFSFGSGDRESSEQQLQAALPDAEAEDLLLFPVTLFNDRIKNTFNMTADVLFALPFQPVTLKTLGFFPDKPNAVCLYVQRGERDYNIEIHRPEWGKKDYDVRFFTPLSDEYRIVATYNMDERKFLVSADDNDMGGANFEFFYDTQEHIDGWCSNKELTVEEYFIKAYNDPAIEDVYLHSIELMEQYFPARFGMTFEELYKLPACE